MQLDYAQYDANGNLRQRNEAITASSSSFTYDALDRLDTGSNPSFFNYDHDANGNRTLFQKDLTSTSYGYSPNTNRLTQVGTSIVTLDASGNLTAQGSRTYTYNALERLVRAYEGGSQIGAYTYNGLGQRISKQAGGATTSFVYGLEGQLLMETSGATAREYLYLNGEPLAAMDQAVATGSPTVTVTTVPALRGGSIYVNWNGIATPAPLDWVGIYTPGSNDFAYLDWAYTNGGSSGTVNVSLSHPSLVAGNAYEARLYANDGYTLLAKTPPFTVVAGASGSYALYYAHNDHLGTPQVLTNEAGAVVWRATYDPFGWATVNEDPDGNGVKVTMNLRYGNSYADAETGWWRMGFRYYDPESGRFPTSDPIGLAGGLNTYSYVYNNPLRYIDPLGLKVYLTSHNISPSSSWHTALLLIPDNQSSFANRPGFLKGGAGDGLANGKWYTVISAEPASSNPFSPGSLIGERNRSSDLPGENTVNREVTASGPLTYSNTCRAKPPSDTELINYLINFAASYGNNAPYGYPRRFSNTGELLPDTYNSNSYTAGILRAINANTAAPSDDSFPGFNRPLPLNFFSSPKY